MQPRAYHSAEIEYVFSMLPEAAKPWPQDDLALAGLMSTYWANFAKTGDPNGEGLPRWPQYSSKDEYEVMHFNAESKAWPDRQQARYQFLDSWNAANSSTAGRGVSGR